MLTKWGYRVKNLDRISYAGLGKNSLKPAQWRHLKKREVNMLKNKAGL
jgi:16S rRNA U516 pseudouridylate synthase RsuA-like enzyme